MKHPKSYTHYGYIKHLEKEVKAGRMALRDAFDIWREMQRFTYNSRMKNLNIK